MQRVPDKLFVAFPETIDGEGVPGTVRDDHRRWLRFYVDFCAKYRHPPRDRDSLVPFLQKLASKQQAPERQKQASASVGLYYRNRIESGSVR